MMLKHLVLLVLAPLRSHRQLGLENLPIRHQLEVLQRNAKPSHLGLEKDAPELRTVESPDLGPAASKPVLGGLHHRYYRDVASLAKVSPRGD